MGTPDYMAPEQIEGQRGDQRTDVYALGTILYEMLAGKTPFAGDNNLAVMAQHLHKTAPRLDKINPNVSPELAAIAAKCLQRDPADRYASMRLLMDALEHPEATDLTILDKVDESSAAPSMLQSQTTKAIGIALAIMVAIVLLAYLLQSIH